MPQAVIAKIRDGVVQTIGTVAICEMLVAQLTERMGPIQARFPARIDGGIARWTPAIKAVNIKANKRLVTASGW